MVDAPQLTEPLELFYSYSHKDEDLRDKLETHLSMLKRQKVISQWHDRVIIAGQEWGGEIDEHLKSADIILLLVSADFLASDYCYDIELKLAMERHEAGEACVIPVILRPCDWSGAPFSKLHALPRNAKPVTIWSNHDEAFTDIVQGIRKAVVDALALRKRAAPAAGAAAGSRTSGETKGSGSRIPRPPIVGFVARRDEQGRNIIGRLTEELAPADNRLVALWGPGGSGKSTLAAEFVRATQSVFQSRVAWVSALGRAGFPLATLLDEVATALGREDLRRLSLGRRSAQVAALVSEAPTLVVLDNFETISEKEQKNCVDFLALGAACPALVTTRSFIGRNDVYNIPLAAMSMEEGREFLRRLVVKTRKPSVFDGLDRDDLIRRCEANPLVLQWVVRQIELARRPQDVLNDLAQGEGDAADLVFTRSFQLPQVGDDGRAALLALSLFTPDASREALAEVSGFGGGLRRLDEVVEDLSALWLVEATEGNERLFLRGLTRELAKSRLSGSAHGLEFTRRFVACFLGYAAAYAHETAEDFDALEAEKDNLLGAMDAAFEMQDWPGVMQLRARLDTFLVLRGYWGEAIRSAGQAEAAAHNAGSELDAAVFRNLVAFIRKGRGEYEEARRVFNETLEIAGRLGGEKVAAECLLQLAIIAKLLGDLVEAWRLCGESLEINKRLGHPLGVAMSVWGLGNIALERGDVEEAKGLLTEALEALNGLNDQAKAAGVLHQLGNVAHAQGNLEEARRLFSESLKIEERFRNRHGIAISLHTLGLLADEQGDGAEAARLFRQALDIYEKLGSPEAEKVREDLTRVVSRFV